MRRTRQRGFTLVEIMVVVVIISMMASMSIFMFIEHQKTAEVKLTRSMISTTGEALKLYRLSKRKFPDSLSQLVPKYVKEVPRDAWGNELIYQKDSQATDGYRLGSHGMDGAPGGEDENADLWNTDTRENE